MSEIHLFLIWSEAKESRKKIIKDLEGEFKILHVETVAWSSGLFSENLSRLYGQKLPNNSFKQKHCGTGPFTCIIVEDINPIYESIDIGSGRGFLSLNKNIYNLKSKYREWTGGGHKIHATNNKEESEHDIRLIFHKKPIDFKINEKLEYYDLDIKYRDLLGAQGYKNSDEFLLGLNSEPNYVIMRGEIDEYFLNGSEDIDLLVENKKDFIYTLNLKHQGKKFSTSRYQVKIGDIYVHIDINYIGDGCFDSRWQKRMLNERIINDGIYTLSKCDKHKADIYHNVIHKNIINKSEHLTIFNSVINEFDITIPQDPMIEYHGYKYNGPKDNLYRQLFPIYREIRYVLHKIKTKILSL